MWLHHQTRNLVLVVLFYGTVLLLHILLPAYRTAGYVCDWRGRRLLYRLNGPLLMAVVVGVPLCLYARGTIPLFVLSFAAENYWSLLACANMLGFLCSFLLVALLPLEPSFRCLTVDQEALCGRAAKGEDVGTSLQQAPKRSKASHFFFGTSFNPRIGSLDIKMALYALGAAALAWNLVSAVALRLFRVPGVDNLSLALKLYAAMLSWFLLEYMFLEVIHLYTFDLMCEKLGFKLCWGCLVYYPFFYCIPVWSLVEAPPNADITTATGLGIVMLFFCGWILTRGANVQKYLFKTRGPQPQISVLGVAFVLPMRVVPRTRLLCSGFWGLARHVNYLGEIIQAIALALPGYLVSPPNSYYYQVLPWLYPLYYVALFLPRQMDDDLQIEAKYGKDSFKEYRRLVPYRIVPGIW